MCSMDMCTVFHPCVYEDESIDGHCVRSVYYTGHSGRDGRLNGGVCVD